VSGAIESPADLVNFQRFGDRFVEVRVAGAYGLHGNADLRMVVIVVVAAEDNLLTGCS
jgi:hypothetical protein